MKYADYFAVAETGDLGVDSGTSAFSAIIKNSTQCKYSHAFMVVWGQHCGQEPGTLWIHESTGIGVHEAPFLDATNTPGVTWLRKRMNPGAGEVAIRRLIVDRTPEMYANLQAHFDEVRGRPYEENQWELVRAVPWIKAFAGLVDYVAKKNLAMSQEDLSSVFCWEGAISALQAFGVVPKIPPANYYSNCDCVYGDLHLLLGAKLMPLETIEIER